MALFDKVDGFANFTRCAFNRNRADSDLFDGKGGAIFVDQVNAGTHTQCHRAYELFCVCVCVFAFLCACPCARVSTSTPRLCIERGMH